MKAWCGRRIISLAAVLQLGLFAGHLPSASAASEYVNQCAVGQKLMLPVHSWTNPDMPIKGVIVALQGLIFSGKIQLLLCLIVN